jgi:signal-transduction protein with cAMP-binding, CBS, and nucleotidyltransferase domain
MLESRYLKDNIENIQKLLAIPALKNFETKSLGKLLRLSKIREYEDGERIIKEGDFDTWLYFILAGKIRITKEGMEIGTIEKKGEIFGEMRVIDSLSRSASVYAVGKIMCLAVDTSAKRRLSAGSTQEEKLDYYNNRDQYIGKLITVEYSILTKDGKPFQPVAIAWRD